MLKENENVTSPITEQPSVDPNSTLGLAPLLNNQSLILKRRMKTIYLEKSNSWQKCCLGSFRAVEININDIANRRVIHIERPLGCFGCCCSILYPFCNAEFMVRKGTQIFKVRGPGLDLLPLSQRNGKDFVLRTLI
ncbi:FLRT [Lepeophtheirus salmonis]|uniref:Phospholipid scramblase n=1 Tax=Lepeophtheirus salmonis TaxID=72036 RepID=A0A7R8H9N9_LEPSM|nr:FLRT [Lepeophtheirus salmonis]CAF2952800.1 FLRT [Lepeophtheirus salmonis]